MLTKITQFRYAQALLPGTLPILCHAAILFTPWRPVWLILIAATLAFYSYPQEQNTPGRHAQGRVLLAFTPVTAAVATGTVMPVAWSIAMVATATMIAVEALLAKVVSAAKIATAHLETRPKTSDSPVRRSALYYLSTFAVLVVQLPLLVPSFAAATPYAVVLAALPTAVLAAARFAGLTSRILPSTEGIAQIVAAELDRRGPSFMVYFAGPKDTTYQFEMWVPYFERIEGPYFVMTRERHHLPALAAATDAPVVFIEGQGPIDTVIPESVTTVFYVNNGMKNMHMVRNAGLTHVQLLHGDSEKVSSYNPVTAMYDRVFVAGQAGIDRYTDHGVDIPADRFDIVGRPQVAALDVPHTAIGSVESPTVMYAPTWTGFYEDANYCSLKLGPKLVKALLERGATVVFRTHPYNDRNEGTKRKRLEVEELLRADAAATGRAHRWGAAAESETTLFDCINASDALVCDVSAVASDWLYTEKPFAVVDARSEGAAFAETFPPARAAYVVTGSGSNIEAVLDDLLGADPLAEVRREAKTYYLGDFPAEGYDRVFIETAQKYIGAARSDGLRAADR